MLDPGRDAVARAPEHCGQGGIPFCAENRHPGGEADIPPSVPAENRLALDRNLSMPRREGFFDATPSREEAAMCWIKRKDIPTLTPFLVLRPADWNRH